MKRRLGIRTKIAAASALATVYLLSLLGSLGYNAILDATRDSQLTLLNERLDQLEVQLESGDSRLLESRQIDTSLLVIREGSEVPPELDGTIRVVRPHPDPEIVSIVGLADTTRIDSTFVTILTALWVSVTVVSLLVGAVAWLVVDRALSPVRRLILQAETNMKSDSLDSVTAPNGTDEISRLANTFNLMLNRLRDADVERRRFVSDASHELRTPLMVLGAEAEYASKSSPAESPKDYEALADVVLTQTDRLAHLVDGLLDLAALDEERPQPLEAVTVDYVVRQSNAALLEHELLDDEASTLIPDITRSLSNIVANARRHSDERVAITVQVDGETVRFIVDDDGPGIPVDERKLIFERFYRPDGHRNRQHGGAGLGLAIAHSEISQAQGSILIDDSHLGGARFSITVPISDQQNTL